MTRFMRWVCKVLGRHDRQALVISLVDDLGNTEYLYYWRCARCDHFEDMDAASSDQLRLMLEPSEDYEAHSLELH